MSHLSDIQIAQKRGFLSLTIASINTPLYMKFKCHFHTVALNHLNMRVSFLLFFSILHYIAQAEQGKDILIHEITRFCKDNGHNYLNFLEDDKTPEYFKRLLYKSGRSFHRFCTYIESYRVTQIEIFYFK